MMEAAILTTAGVNFGLRRSLAPYGGLAAGFGIQVIAVCGGLAILQAHWPQLHGALQCLGAGCLLLLAWSMLGWRARLNLSGAGDTFWESAARQLLNPKAWLLSLTAATLLLPAQLEQALADCCTATI